MKKEKKQEVIIPYFCVDTNVLIDLDNYIHDHANFKLENTPLHYYEVKTLAEVLEEDMMSMREGKVHLLVSQTVMDELIKNITVYEGKALRAKQRFQVETFKESGDQSRKFKSIYYLLRGNNKFFPNIVGDLFGNENNNDCKIITSAIVSNMPVLTSNINHFAGDDGSVEQEIKDRLDVWAQNDVIKRSFDTNHDNYSAYSISRFLHDFFPEKYNNMKDLVTNAKRVPCNIEK